MPNNDQSQDIAFEIRGNVALITLNRPRALNALTHNMMKTIARLLDGWEKDDAIKAVFFFGAGDRAFCAGGDIKHACEQGLAYKENSDVALSPNEYFFDEYNLNRRLFHYSKPLFAIMDGVTMGGGFGIAGPCKYRIATERTVFAMPEVGIGFFPDIGGVYYLLKCPDLIGRYLCLSGQPISYEDVLYSGIATHYCTSDDIEQMLNKLISTFALDSGVDSILGSYEPNAANEGELAGRNDLIQKCFSHETVNEIIECVEARDDKWSQELSYNMRRRSPLSMEITMRHLQMAERGESFDTVIARDYQLCQHFMGGTDFYEGVRAAVIDKDRSPKWQHVALKDVTKADVDEYFKETGKALY